MKQQKRARNNPISIYSHTHFMNLVREVIGLDPLPSNEPDSPASSVNDWHSSLEASARKAYGRADGLRGKPTGGW